MSNHGDHSRFDPVAEIPVQTGARRRKRRFAHPRSRHRLGGFVLGMLLTGLSGSVYGQQTFVPSTSETELPDAPGRESSRSQPDQQFAGSISGIVLDIREAIVPDAHVTLENSAGEDERTVTSDSAGAFTFTNLPAGTYKVKITAEGLETFVSYNIALHDAEKLQLPRIALPIAANSSEVTVTVTEDQLAEEQIQAEIKQRTLGVFPNFYTSYIWNAAPLKTRHKFQLALRATIDPVTLLSTGVTAGIQQARNSYAAYGQGAKGYAKRYGADYGDIVIGRMLGSAVLPSIFHQDPRYFYQGKGSVSSRAFHAVSSAVVCRGDNGHTQFNFSRVLGYLASSSITNLYRPDEDRGARDIAENSLIHIGTNAATNLIREFVLRSITTKIPTYANGKP
jgi:Carboxypeptidase regulatory-like domain